MKKLSESVFYVGVLNPSLRVFDIIMKTEYGTSYNSYIVKGSEKTAIIEAAHLSFAQVYRQELESVLDRAPDFLILNHTEPDHSGLVSKVIDWYPNIQIVASPGAAIYIKSITNNPNLNLQVVKDGDTLSLGDKTLRFINAPFLHWPDSMFTYLEEDKFVFTCDFLGSHYCEQTILDTEIIYPEKYYSTVRNYFDCIFSPFKTYVKKGLERLAGLDIEFVCPSHGVVLTAGGRLNEIISLYSEWSEEKVSENKKIPIFYCTAYGNTQKLAKAVQDGISGVLPSAELEIYNIIEHDMLKLAALLNSSDAFLLGSVTINKDSVPPVWHLLALVDAINVANRPVALFGSFGWSGEALDNIENRLIGLKFNVFNTKFKINFVPSQEDLKRAEAFGVEFAKTLC